jgi:hypothetical protein
MMSTVVWTVLTFMALAGMFGACTLAVVAGIRLLEGALDRRRRQPQA